MMRTCISCATTDEVGRQIPAVALPESVSRLPRDFASSINNPGWRTARSLGCPGENKLQFMCRRLDTVCCHPLADGLSHQLLGLSRAAGDGHLHLHRRGVICVYTRTPN